VGIRTTLTLWRPPDETIEAIAAVLSSHWAAARRSQPGGLFGAPATSWLRQQARRLADNGREWYLQAVRSDSAKR
jgi:hypothetical protein